MPLLVVLIVSFIFIFILSYRKNQNANVYQFVVNQVGGIYDKYAPYSFKEVREKTIELGQEYTVRDYTIQVLVFAGFAGLVSYLYFYNIVFSILYISVAVGIIPYLAYLRCNKVFNEFIFEQIQVYTTNVIMEYSTVRSFVKALEGVAVSGVLEDPVLSDVKKMIDLSYQNGSINEAINFMNKKYDYYIVKNMHQLFLQITNEGSKDSQDALEVMLNDIDMLVSAVYIDKVNRNAFHKSFITFGLGLYFLIGLVQFLVGNASYLKLLQNPIIIVLLNGIVFMNSYLLLKGEKYYNENLGAE